MQVMLIKNISADLVNGSVGVVHDFMTIKDFHDWASKQDLGGGLTNATRRQREGANTDHVLYPVVRFTVRGGGERTREEVFMQLVKSTFTLKSENRELLAARTQAQTLLVSLASS